MTRWSSSGPPHHSRHRQSPRCDGRTEHSPTARGRSLLQGRDPQPREAASGSVSEVIKTALIEQSADLRVPLDLVERARNVLAGFRDLTVDQSEQPDVLNLAVRPTWDSCRAWRADERGPGSHHSSRDSSPSIRAGRRTAVRCIPQDDQRGCCMTVQVAPPPAVGTSQDVRAGVERQSGWLVVAEQECRDLWTSGRGLMLLFLFSVLLSAVTYLTSTNQALNFLEQRESVNLVLQFAVAVGVLATLVVSAMESAGSASAERWRRCWSRRSRDDRSLPASSSPRCRCGSPHSSSASPTSGSSLAEWGSWARRWRSASASGRWWPSAWVASAC